MEEKNMNEKNPVMVPYIVHESILSRQERQIKRLWILCVIIFLALVITNAGWICYEAQYETLIQGLYGLSIGASMLRLV